MYYCCVFFSSRRRHTRCALVTGVQTCALPICCLLLLMMSRVMPESPRWLAARGRDVEADAVVRKFERHQRIEAVNSPAPFTASDASATGSASPPISYLRLLVVACVMKTRSEEHTSELQ